MIKTSGLPDDVEFTEKEQKFLKGATFTHNHPMVDGQDVPFSRTDLSFARQTGLAEIRAVSGNTVFSITPSPAFFKIPKTKFEAILNGFRDKEIRKLGYSPSEFESSSTVKTKILVLENTFKSFDKAYGIKYTKTTLTNL
jgi:hypothetical protein